MYSKESDEDDVGILLKEIKEKCYKLKHDKLEAEVIKIEVNNLSDSEEPIIRIRSNVSLKVH